MLKLSRKTLTRASLFILTSMFLSSAAIAEEELVLHVPKLKTPPKIDGKLEKGEWDNASAVTAFRGAVHKTAFPESLKMVWYVGYDDKNLYFAMDAKFPGQINLKANIKEPDDGQILYDDHVEIQVSSAGRQGAKTGGKGFYKLVINPRAVMQDTWYNNGTPGTEDLWSSGAIVKSSNGKGFWRLEIAWPFQTMRVKHIDYRDLIVHISRAVEGRGWYFASMAPGTWDMWQGFYRFRLDPNAPSIQFLQKGEIVEGQLDTLVKVRSKKGDNIGIGLSIRNGKGQTICSSKKQSTNVPAGETRCFTFKANNLQITEDGNSYRMEVYDNIELLYRALVPFRKYTKEYYAKNVIPWMETRPVPGEYGTDVAYYPTGGVVMTKVDLDVFGGLPEKYQGAVSYKAKIMNGKGKTVASETFKISGNLGKGTVKVGDLPEDDYVCRLELLDRNGKVIDGKSAKFVRRHYEWEGNRLGMDDVVLPGFAPLDIKGKTIKQCRNTVTIGKGGLPVQIVSDGHKLLAEPIKIEASVNGKTRSWQPDDVSVSPVSGRTFPSGWKKYMWKKNCPVVKVDDLPETDGYAANITGDGKVDGVSIKVDNEMGYDGWQRIRLTYGPESQAVKIDRLDVVITLEKWADLMRAGRMFSDVKGEVLPDKEGILWQSGETAANPRHFLGTWIPCAYLGNGSRGLWYMAESDKGWSLDDNKSCVFIERRNGKPALRLCLVNKPTTIDRIRTVDFSLIATPAKLRPKNPRWRVWSSGCPNGEVRSPVLWYNTGWRKYAYAGDGFYMPDEGFKELGQWLANPEDFKKVRNWATNWTRGQKKVYGEKVWNEQMPVVVYSSHSNFSPALPELATYGGEWFGKNNLEHGRDYKYSRKIINKKITSFTGRYPYDTPAKAGEIQGMWNRSLMDCYTWYHHKLFTKSGVNGTFYDNAGLVWWLNPQAGIGYVREDGHAQPQSNIYVRHKLTKRLNTLCWLVGKPPMFYPSGTTLDIPFAQKMMAIEGEWYIWTIDGTIFDNNSVDGIRARMLSKGNETCIVAAKKALHRNRQRGAAPGASHRPLRSLFALCLALDIGCDRTAWDRAETRRLVKMLNDAIGLFNEKDQAEFIPYWDNKDVAYFVDEMDRRFKRVRPKHQFCSLYRKNGKVLVWLVNESPERVHRNLYLDAKDLVGHPVKTIRDLETGEVVSHLNRNRKDPLRTSVWANLYLPPKDFRAFILE